MKMGRAIAMLAFCGGLAGCGDGPTSADDSRAEVLYGSWTWVYSCCGITGEPDTPASTGTSMTYVFEPPNVWRVYRNEALVSTTTFTLVRSGTVGHSTLLFAAVGWDAEVRVQGNTLEIIPRHCADCTTDRFERMEPGLDWRRSPG